MPNVLFPCASLHDEESKEVVYYGAADTVVGVAFGRIQEIIDWLKDHSI